MTIFNLEERTKKLEEVKRFDELIRNLEERKTDLFKEIEKINKQISDLDDAKCGFQRAYRIILVRFSNKKGDYEYQLDEEKD